MSRHDVSPLAKGRKLNWRPSLGNHHVKKYKHLELCTAPKMLPASADLRSLQSPVWDQGQSGSCSGYSCKSGMEYLQLMEIRNKAPQGSDPLEFAQNLFTPVSAFFPYWNARAVEGTTDQDAGASSLLDIYTQVQLKGICKESTWPSTDPSQVTVCPPSTAYAEAYHHKLPDFYNLDGSLAEFQRCLSSGFGFAFGIAVYESFMSNMVASNGIVPMPGSSEQMVGGHALWCVGYDNSHQWFIFKNSWSTQWGAAGYGFLPYDYMLNGNLSDDYYTPRLVPTATR